MCGSSPDIPPPPPPPQETKQPEAANVKESARRNRTGLVGGGSLLTGPTGISAGSLTTGKATLLGQ
jgi:hypothetical protein